MSSNPALNWEFFYKPAVLCQIISICDITRYCVASDKAASREIESGAPI